MARWSPHRWCEYKGRSADQHAIVIAMCLTRAELEMEEKGATEVRAGTHLAASAMNF